MRWHSIHVHYYDGPHLDQLVVSGVQPVFAALAGEVSGAYFTRHWRRGPHLRLNLRCEPGRFRSAVYPMAERELRGYLARHPSRAHPDPSALLPLHQQLATLEREHGPLLPWHPDNSVRVAPYDPRLEVLGSEVAADLLAEFLTDSTPLAFAMTEHLVAGGQRLRLVFDLLIALGHTAGGGITASYQSYRSHAEAFLAAAPGVRDRADADRRRQQWQQHYARHATALVARVQRVVAAVTGQGPAVPFVAEWVELARRYRDRGQQLLTSGELLMAPAQAADHQSPLWRSEFHRELAGDADFQQRIRHSVDFAVWRLVLNYTYLQLTRLGVSPYERFLSCHLVADAVTDAYQTAPLET